MALDESTLKRWILGKISSGEAKSYNEVYGGGTFNDYSDHPRQQIPLGNGNYTTAAGLYQFLAPTWDEEKARLNLPDFSPASQDAAAWDLASRTYQANTGRSLLDDAEKQNIDWNALAGTWTSLGKQTGQAPAMQAVPSVAAEPAKSEDDGAARMAALTRLQSLAPHLSFTPVDYDPFAIIGESNGKTS